MSRRARPRPIPEAPESGAIKLLCVTRRRKKKTKKKTQRTRPLLSVNTSSVLLRLHVFCGEAPRALRCASRAESRTAESRSSLRRSLDDTLNRVLPTEARTHLNPPSHTRRYCFLPPCRLFLFFFLIEQADEVRNIVSQETMVLYVIKRERKNREVAVSLLALYRFQSSLISGRPSPTGHAPRDELTKQPDISKAHVLVTTPIISFRYVAKAVTEFAFTQSRNILD